MKSGVDDYFEKLVVSNYKQGIGAMQHRIWLKEDHFWDYLVLKCFHFLFEYGRNKIVKQIDNIKGQISFAFIS